MNTYTIEVFTDFKKGLLTRKQYVSRLLAAPFAPAEWEDMIRDPARNAVRDAMLHANGVQSEYVALFKRLFVSILVDEAGAIDILRSTPYIAKQTRLAQTIAVFAALHAKPQVLQQCLRMGASLDEPNTTMALECATRDGALMEFLYRHDWRDIRKSRLAFARMAEWSLHTSRTELAWFLDHGAELDHAVIRRASRSAPVHADCVEELIQRLGGGIFVGSGLLQSAAKKGHTELVQTLLDAGVDVDELLPRTSYDDGEGEFTALYEAVYKQHHDTIQILLGYGADPIKQVCEAGLNTPLRLAEAHGYSTIASMLRRILEKRCAGQRVWASRL